MFSRPFVLGVLATLSLGGTAVGQGTIASLANSLGSTIYPLCAPEGSLVKGDLAANYKVEVFLFGTDANPFAVQLGSTVGVGTNGRFNAGSSVAVPGKAPGTTATLIVRAWDTTSAGGNSYETAAVRGKSAPFATDLLGGDPDGDGPLLPITPKGMVTGTAAGFTGFICIPEPTEFALLIAGSLGVWARSRRRLVAV